MRGNPRDRNPTSRDQFTNTFYPNETSGAPGLDFETWDAT